jgi:hypothetical protein
MLLLSQLTGWKIDESLGKQAATLAERAAELDDSDPLGTSRTRLRRPVQAAH